MRRKILIIDDHDDLATALDEVFSALGHEVQIIKTRREAVRHTTAELNEFDLVITDLDNDEGSNHTISNQNGNSSSENSVAEGERVKAFKISAVNFRRHEFNEDELKELVAVALDYKTRFVDREEVVQNLRENIEFELPSSIGLMHIILEYLMMRVEKVGVVNSATSNLFIALDEAFVNAVKHGNKFDAAKNVRISTEVSVKEARFTIEDEGEGFDVSAIPNPCDPENLFKTSGRGVLFIYNIMDEVKYNERGNRLTMTKKSDKTERV